MSIDPFRLLERLIPEQDGEDVLRLRTGVVNDIAADGTVDVELSETIVPDVPVLAGVSLVEGLTVQVLSYRGALLIIGVVELAAAQPVAASAANTNGGTVTPGTSFTNTLASTGIHGVAFIAPASGRVLVGGRAIGRNDTAGGFVLLDFEVRAGSTPGSGTVFRAADTNTAGVFESSTAGQESTLATGTLISGLTPGSAYNATLTYAAGAGSQQVAYNRRHISVLPA